MNFVVKVINWACLKSNVTQVKDKINLLLFVQGSRLEWPKLKLNKYFYSFIYLLFFVEVLQL